MSETLYSVVARDQITDAVAQMFDYPFNNLSSFTLPDMPVITRDFSIGLIVGPSGSGKSNLLRRFGTVETPHWDNHVAVCSHFASAKDATERLTAVGLNSIPSWMKPYCVLSTGEKFRADTARTIKSGAVIDEFTSVVDRTVASSCSNAINRYIHRTGLKRVVFATCHYDVIPWLRPDWVYDTLTKSFQQVSVRRPPIELEIIPCSAEAWSLFKDHHYLDGAINKSARCWIAVWDDRPVGFAACVAFPNGNFKNGWRGHRTVVLPDYQGLGIGVRLSDAIAQIMIEQGCRYFSKTSHPRMGQYRENSLLWKATSKNRKARADYRHARKTKEDGHKMKHAHRLCYSHEYVGAA